MKKIHPYLLFRLISCRPNTVFNFSQSIWFLWWRTRPLSSHISDLFINLSYKSKYWMRTLEIRNSQWQQSLYWFRMSLEVSYFFVLFYSPDTVPVKISTLFAFICWIIIDHYEYNRTLNWFINSHPRKCIYRSCDVFT